MKQTPIARPSSAPTERAGRIKTTAMTAAEVAAICLGIGAASINAASEALIHRELYWLFFCFLSFLPFAIWFVVLRCRVSNLLFLTYASWIALEWVLNQGRTEFTLLFFLLILTAERLVQWRRRPASEDAVEPCLKSLLWLTLVFVIREFDGIGEGLRNQWFSNTMRVPLYGQASGLYLTAFSLWLFYGFFRSRRGEAAGAEGIVKWAVGASLCLALLLFFGIQAPPLGVSWSSTKDVSLVFLAPLVLTAVYGIFLTLYLIRAGLRSAWLGGLTPFLVGGVLLARELPLDVVRRSTELLTAIFSKPAKELLIGHGKYDPSSFGRLFMRDSSAPTGQIGEIPALLSQGGIALGSVLLWIVLSAAWTSRTERKKQPLRLALFAGFFFALFFPGLFSPLNLILLSLTLALCFPGRGDAAPMPAPQVTFERWVRRGLAAAFFCLMLFAGINSIIAALKVRRGPAVQASLLEPKSVPKDFVLGVILQEDIFFFRHRGINWGEVRTSIVTNIKQRRFTRGASTITMQLAKMCYLGSEKTISRKVQQFLIAAYLELTMTKEEILAEYLSVLDFGIPRRGVEAAAEHYFQTPLSELGTERSLDLVLSIPNPKVFNPTEANRFDLSRMNKLKIRMGELRWMVEPDIEKLSYVKD